MPDARVLFSKTHESILQISGLETGSWSLWSGSIWSVLDCYRSRRFRAVSSSSN